MNFTMETNSGDSFIRPTTSIVVPGELDSGLKDLEPSEPGDCQPAKPVDSQSMETEEGDTAKKDESQNFLPVELWAMVTDEQWDKYDEWLPLQVYEDNGEESKEAFSTSSVGSDCGKTKELPLSRSDESSGVKSEESIPASNFQRIKSADSHTSRPALFTTDEAHCSTSAGCSSSKYEEPKLIKCYQTPPLIKPIATQFTATDQTQFMKTEEPQVLKTSGPCSLKLGRPSLQERSMCESTATCKGCLLEAQVNQEAKIFPEISWPSKWEDGSIRSAFQPYKAPTVLTNVQRGNIETTTPQSDHGGFSWYEKAGRGDLTKTDIDEVQDIDAADTNGYSALMWSAAYGQDDSVLLLLDNGADVHVRGQHFETALHLAATGGHHEVVRHLITFGADPDLLDNEGNTPLMYAVHGDHFQAVQELIDEGASMLDPDSYSYALMRGSTNAQLVMENFIMRGLLNEDRRNPPTCG